MLKNRFGISRNVRDGESENQKSRLECVVDMLKGTRVLCRRRLKVTEATIWLTPNMKSLRWRVYAKTRDKENEEFELPFSRIVRLKVLHREISLVSLEGRESYNFVMFSRDRTVIWGHGLRCLIPELASGGLWNRKRNVRLPPLSAYDPITEKYEGKPLSEKRVLGEIIVLGNIGRGAFGSVKLGLSLENRLFYAVKVLSKSMIRRYNRNLSIESEDSEAIAELPEISVMRHLKHQNVVKMKEVIDDDTHDCLCIVTEYMANGPIMSSAKLSGTKPLRENQAREAFIDVLTGLHYLQTRSIAHRDIKPDNLLRGGDGTVKISDFGTAKVYSGPSDWDNKPDSNSPTVGTPAFAAPEMCLHSKAPEKPARAFKADLWSLGATLYYMVYGRAPFQARSVFEMYEVICTKKLRFPTNNEMEFQFVFPTAECEDVIKRLLEKHPDDRPSIEQILDFPWIAKAIDIRKKVTKLREQIRNSSCEVC